MNWSGGKDSALTLHRVLQAKTCEVVKLLTITDASTGCACHHNIPLALLKAQANAIGIDLDIVEIKADQSEAVYQQRLTRLLKDYQQQGIELSIFGDIFLEDLKNYRAQKCAQAGFTAIFPLWKNDTADLAREFIDTGLKAVITSVDTQKLSPEFLGRYYDAQFLNDLPAFVDPCGENGEFHSFAFAGPIFSTPIKFRLESQTHSDSRFQTCLLSLPIDTIE